MRKERKKKNTFLINLTYYIGGLIMSKNNIIINEARNGYPVKVTYLEGYFHKTTMEGGIPPFYLETLVINNGIEKIGDKAFESYEGLKEVRFPSSLKEIGDKAFENCDSLKTITLPEGCKTLGSMAFAYCFDLETVIIPSSMERIESDTFHRCINLKYFIVLNPEMDVSKIELPDECKIIRGVEEKR